MRTAIYVTSITPELALISFYFSKLANANVASILASEAEINHASHTNVTSIPALFLERREDV